MIPQTYDEWYRCITVSCGIRMDSRFIAERINAMENRDDTYTQDFICCYGTAHYQNVLTWFYQAQHATTL